MDDFEKSDNGEDSGSDVGSEDADSYEYELIGVTVHTGTADGGHYYSFIRDRINKNELGHDRWFAIYNWRSFFIFVLKYIRLLNHKWQTAHVYNQSTSYTKYGPPAQHAG